MSVIDNGSIKLVAHKDRKQETNKQRTKRIRESAGRGFL